MLSINNQVRCLFHQYITFMESTVLYFGTLQFELFVFKNEAKLTDFIAKRNSRKLLMI